MGIPVALHPHQHVILFCTLTIIVEMSHFIVVLIFISLVTKLSTFSCLYQPFKYIFCLFKTFAQFSIGLTSFPYLIFEFSFWMYNILTKFKNKIILKDIAKYITSTFVPCSVRSHSSFSHEELFFISFKKSVNLFYYLSVFYSFRAPLWGYSYLNV